MNTWKNLALLQPIESKWLTLDFKVWRAGMLTANLSMVATEAPAWAFVASVVFGGGTLACIAGCIVGLIMACVIWTADAGIVTADVEAVRRFRLAVGARLFFVLISVGFTARYISTFVLTADIQNEWQKQNIALVQQKSTELFKPKLDSLNTKIEEKHQALDLEVEGRRKSGVIGCGSICKQLQIDLADLNGQLTKAKDEQNEFNRLAADPVANAPVLAAKYGLVLPPLTMKARNEILAELTKQPGYRATELTVRAWVFLIFIAMLLAKLAQPESAKLVYRQSLRPKIEKFEAGEYDTRLSPPYRSTAKPCHMTLAYLSESTDFFRVNEMEVKRLKLINDVKSHLETVRGEVAAAEEKVEQARQACTAAGNRRSALQDGIAGLDRSLGEIAVARKSLEQTAFSPQRVHEMVELANFEQAALRQKDALRRELEAASGEATRSEATLDSKEQLLAAIKEQMGLAESELQAMQWSVAKSAATEFARLVAGDAAPETAGQRKAAVAGSEPQQPLLRSLAGSGKAALAGLLESRINGVPAPASLLRRTVSAYLHSKLVTIGAIVALVCAVLIATSFFAHGVLTRLH